MKYYEGHEKAYRKLKASGHVCWDKTAFDGFYMRPFLEAALTHMQFKHDHPRALELGCGTGPLSCLLAQKGFDVRGIDISASAVELAREEAAKRGLAIRYDVGDVCALPEGERFDLIVDAHCLHCIVWDEDRARVLSSVKRLLNDDGYFLIETMAHRAGLSFGDAFRYDERGIVWAKAPENRFADCVCIDGQWYVPSRRLLLPEQLKSELVHAGFRTELCTIHDQGEKDPPEFQAICR